MRRRIEQELAERERQLNAERERIRADMERQAAAARAQAERARQELERARQAAVQANRETRREARRGADQRLYGNVHKNWVIQQPRAGVDRSDVRTPQPTVSVYDPRRNVPSPQYQMPNVGEPSRATTTSPRVTTYRYEQRTIRTTQTNYWSYASYALTSRGVFGMIAPPPAQAAPPAETGQPRADRAPQDQEWVAGEKIGIEELEARKRKHEEDQKRLAQRSDAWRPAEMTCPRGAGRNESTITSRDWVSSGGSGGTRQDNRPWPCAETAGWSPDKPYNQGEPIVFRPAFGKPVTIGRNQVLISVYAPGTITGRAYRAEDYDPRIHDRPSTGNCADWQTEAPNRIFRVSIGCEMGRQQELLDHKDELMKAMERREDARPFMDWDECKGEIKYTEDWQTRTTQDWLADGAPIAQCIDNRRDATRGPLREKGWLRPHECENHGVDTSVNNRGVRGCRLPTVNHVLGVSRDSGLTPDREWLHRLIHGEEQ